MGFTEQACVLVTCDRCGDDFDFEYVPHFDTRTDARDFIEGMGGIVDDDVVICDSCARKPVTA